MSIFLLNLFQTLVIILFFLLVNISFYFSFLLMIQCLFYFINWHVSFSLQSFFLFFFFSSLIRCSLPVFYSFCFPSISITHYLPFSLIISVISIYILITHTIIVCALSRFSIKRPCNQTKVNEVKFPGNHFFLLSNQHKPFPFSSPFFFNFWPPSIGLSLISFIANECFFSFNEYLYKSMAHIQPSFLCFCLF